MKSKIIFICFLMLLLVACGNKANGEIQEETKETMDEQSVVGSGNQTMASYSDGPTDFADLVEGSDCIVIATVEETWQISMLNHSSRLSVTKVIKGDVDASITMWQVAGDNNVNVGDKCILFLRTQNEAKQIYAPKGGGVGVMKYNDSPSDARIGYPIIDEKEFREWIEKVTK